MAFGIIGCFQALSDEVCKQLEKEKAGAISEKTRLAAELDRVLNSLEESKDNDDDTLAATTKHHMQIRLENTSLHDRVAEMEREHAERVDELEAELGEAR